MFNSAFWSWTCKHSSGVRTDWLLGLGRAENGFVLLVDTDRVLTEWDAVAQAESTAETTAADMAVA